MGLSGEKNIKTKIFRAPINLENGKCLKTNASQLPQTLMFTLFFTCIAKTKDRLVSAGTCIDKLLQMALFVKSNWSNAHWILLTYSSILRSPTIVYLILSSRMRTESLFRNVQKLEWRNIHSI